MKPVITLFLAVVQPPYFKTPLIPQLPVDYK